MSFAYLMEAEIARHRWRTGAEVAIRSGAATCRNFAGRHLDFR